MVPNVDAKYTKIEVLVFLGDNQGTNNEEFLNSSIILTGNYLIIVTPSEDETKVVNKVFSLGQIKAYKTHK